MRAKGEAIQDVLALKKAGLLRPPDQVRGPRNDETEVFGSIRVTLSPRVASDPGPGRIERPGKAFLETRAKRLLEMKTAGC